MSTWTGAPFPQVTQIQPIHKLNIRKISWGIQGPSQEGDSSRNTLQIQENAAQIYVHGFSGVWVNNSITFFFRQVYIWLNLVKILWTSQKKRVHLWHRLATSQHILGAWYSVWGTRTSQDKKLPPFCSFKSLPISLQLSPLPPNCKNVNILREEWVILSI